MLFVFSGSLLGQFVAPIYLSSLVLGSFYHNEHLSRAIISRCSSINDLPPVYAPQSPLLSGISASEGRVPGRAPTFAVSWTEGEANIEAITTVRGKTEERLPSKVCKHEMFCLYALARQSLEVRRDVSASGDDVAEMTYSEAKDLNSSYKTAKRVFSQACEQAGLGKWLGKPREQEDFTLKEANAAAAAVVNAAAASAGIIGRMPRQQQTTGEDDQLTGSLFAEDCDGDYAMLEDGGKIQQLQEAIHASTHSGLTSVVPGDQAVAADLITEQIRQIRSQSEVKSNEC